MSERERLALEIAGGIAAMSVAILLIAITGFLFYLGALIVWAMVA